MLNIPFNPMLQKNQLQVSKDTKTVINCNTTLTFAILVLFVLTTISYCLVWYIFSDVLISKNQDVINQIKNFSFVSGVLSFALAFFASYKPGLSPILAPLYALFSGIFIGGLSFSAEIKFPGIAILTTELTLSVFLVMYLGYKFGLIRVTEKFKAIIYTLLGAISLIYLLSFVFMFFNISIPLIHSAGVGGIIWSIFIISVAAFHLVIDIQRVEQANKNLPGFMNWRIALGLLVSLVWLYFTILRLMSKIKNFKQ